MVKREPEMKGKPPNPSQVLGFIGIIASLIAILLGLLIKIVKPDQINAPWDMGYSPFLHQIIFLIIGILFLYEVIMIMYLILRMYQRGKDKDKVEDSIKNQSKWLLKLIYWGPYLIIRETWLFLSIYTLIFLDFMLDGKYFEWSFGIVGIFILLNIVKKYMPQFLKKITKVLTVVFSIPFLFIVLYISLNLVYFLGSDLTIHPDQNHYTNSSEALVAIYPSSLFQRPKIENVYYSNEMILIENRTDNPFPTSPALIIINSSDYKLDSFNSFLLISYRYGKGLYFLPEPVPHIKLYTIPVFDIHKIRDKESD